MSASLDKIKLHGKSHAIEVAEFVITFGVAIDSSDVARLDDRRDILSVDFPAIEEPQSFQIAFGLGHAPAPLQVRHLTYFGNDGKPIWVAQFAQNQLSLSCHKYTKWEEVWPEASKRLNMLLDCVDEFKPVLALDYKVTDTFRCPVQERVLLSSNIFVKSKLIPDFLLEFDDPRWDLSHGRFREKFDNGEVLERIEATSVIENDLAVVRISNLQSFRFEPHLRLKAARIGGDGSQLDTVFSKLHDDNKITLRSILDNRLGRKMGLIDV